MQFSDLPQDAKEAFNDAMESYEGGVSTEEARQLFTNGVENAIENKSYTAGLANHFNLNEDQIKTGDAWRAALRNFNAEDWSQAATQAGIGEKFRNNLVTGLTTE